MPPVTVKIDSSLLSVVEDYAEGVTAAGAKTTHAVTEVHAIHILLSLYRTITNRKHDAIALQQRHNDRPRLHAWSLFRQHEFSACKIFVRL